MSRFEDNPLEFFTSVYNQPAPWDIGGPQPALVELFHRFPPHNPVLDVGSGSGDIALSLAEMGHTVVGMEFVASAVALALENRKRRPPEVAARAEFLQADVFQVHTLGRVFGSIVDSGFYHLLDERRGGMYLDRIRSVLRPHGRLYMLEFAIEFDIPNTPRAVTADELSRVFGPGTGWNILELRSVQFMNRISPVPAIAMCAEPVGREHE